MIDRGDRLGVALSSRWHVEIKAGEYTAAEAAARRACGLLEEMGERSYWSTNACEVAVALYHLGRYGEAKDWASRALEAGARDDATTQLMGREVLAKVAARQDQFDSARALAGEALAIADGMDSPEAQGCAALDVAEVFWLAGDAAAAGRQAERARILPAQGRDGRT
jgi:tetratricopeptide (TPR) repeat protein